jgi:hypothetical protein
VRTVLNYATRFSLCKKNLNLNFWLDKPDCGDSPGAVSLFFSVQSKYSTHIISYNLNKAAVNGEQQYSIRWGLGSLI